MGNIIIELFIGNIRIELFIGNIRIELFIGNITAEFDCYYYIRPCSYVVKLDFFKQRIVRPISNFLGLFPGEL